MTDSRSFLFEDDYKKLGEPWVEDVGDLKQAKSSGKHLILFSLRMLTTGMKSDELWQEILKHEQQTNKNPTMLYTILRQLYWYFLTCLFCRIITTGFSKFLDVLRLVDREMTPEAKVAWWSNLTLWPLFWVAACLNKCDYTFLVKVLTNQKLFHWYFILIINHHLWFLRTLKWTLTSVAQCCSCRWTRFD